MLRERLGRVVRAAVLLGVGVQGLASPVAAMAIRGSMPDCVEASPLLAWAGTSAQVLLVSTDCPHGTYAPAPSYSAFTHATLAVSLTAVILGLVALVVAVGLGVSAQRTLGQLRLWFARRFRMVAADVVLPTFPQPVPVLVSSAARPSRVVSHPHVRRGPPSCSC